MAKIWQRDQLKSSRKFTWALKWSASCWYPRCRNALVAERHFEAHPNLRISFVPTQHSGRALWDQKHPVGAFVIEEASTGLRVYFAGDTGYAEHFLDTRARFGSMDVALTSVLLPPRVRALTTWIPPMRCRLIAI